jgi:hypothetical protein
LFSPSLEQLFDATGLSVNIVHQPGQPLCNLVKTREDLKARRTRRECLQDDEPPVPQPGQELAPLESRLELPDHDLRGKIP